MRHRYKFGTFVTNSKFQPSGYQNWQVWRRNVSRPTSVCLRVVSVRAKGRARCHVFACEHGGAWKRVRCAQTGGRRGEGGASCAVRRCRTPRHVAVATHRRVGSRSERRLPRRSVDGDDAALPVQAPQRAPQRATGRRGRTGREQHLRTWPSTRYAGRTGGSTRVRRCGESTATPSALRRAVQGKTCGVWYQTPVIC